MKNFSFIIFLFLFSDLLAQEYTARIGEWTLHNDFAYGQKVVEVKNRIFCQPRSGLFYLSKEDNSLTTLTKLNGLSDMEIMTMRYDADDDLLLIAYKNTMLDILKDNAIISISDIYRKSIPGKKIINDIFFKDHKAYISCSFGIVVYDLIRQEVKETYSEIGAGGKQVEVYGTTTDAGYIYAATQDGILKASLSSINLLDFHSWTLIKTGVAKKITAFNQAIYSYIDSNLYKYEGGNWTTYLDSLSKSIKSIETCYDKLVICSDKGIYIIDKNYQVDYRSEKGANFSIIDKDGNAWYVLNFYGLIRDDKIKPVSFLPNGPWTNKPWDMQYTGKTLWVIYGALDDSWAPTFHEGSLSFYAPYYSDKRWNNKSGGFNPGFDKFSDLITIAVDPSNEHVYMGSFGYGLVEYYNDQILNIYSKDNSSLLAASGGFDTNTVIVSGLAFDNENNLWISNRLAYNQLSVKYHTGKWKSFYVGQGVNKNVSKLIVDDFNQKWILLQKEDGILVFDENQPANKNYKKLTTGVGNGNLPINNVNSITKDLDGKVWIGTDEGVAVFYDPSLIFSKYNFDAQKIWVDNGDNSGYLLTTEAVTSIAVDGANKKWLGTKRGVWYVSSDGSKIIYNFTTKNSPLPSDYIRDITIDPKSGDVFFATDKGIASFRGTATEGEESPNNVYAFPNPVRPDYQGPIAIRGLARESIVKITDVTGNLVFETKSEGGQAIWDGRNFSGESVRSGIYLVMSANEEGKKSCITKILIIR
jgi:hypothetical protein